MQFDKKRAVVKTRQLVVRVYVYLGFLFYCGWYQTAVNKQNFDLSKVSASFCFAIAAPIEYGVPNCLL